jgi:predicted nucleic acid-binding protein
MMEIDRFPIVLDACCILNLCASGYFIQILESIPTKFMVAKLIYEKELISLQNLSEGNEGSLQFETAIARGLLVIVDFESEPEDEAEQFVNYAARVDDGEAATCAIAIGRNWSIATDDKKAISFAKGISPKLKVFSTLELIKYWSIKESIPVDILSTVLTNVRIKARYGPPPKNHPLYTWWQSSIADGELN